MLVGISAWALAGAGSGSITLKPVGGDAMKTALSMRMGALGVKGQVLDGTGPSGMRVNVKSDAMWVGTKSARSADMMGSEGDATRLRLVAQGERDFALAGQGRLTPSAEVGLRHDAGDAETGMGVELGAGLRYRAGSFTIEGQARTLVAHEASGYEDWGVSGAVRLTPSASGRGLSLSVAPTWGRTGSASEQLWSARDAGELEGGGAFEADGRIEAEVGYGLALPHHRGLLTPYGALTLASEGGRTMRGGARWVLAVALAMTTPLGAGDARYRIGGPEGPVDTVWLGVYRRDALQAAGGFDESLLRNQDYALHWRLRQRGGTVWFTPALQAEYRPRATLAALARQYWAWGRWKRAMLRRHPGSLRWRQLAAPALTAALAASSLATPLAGPVAAAVPLAYLAALALGAVACGLRRRSAAAVLLPAILATMHLAWGAGFWAACLRPPRADPEPEGAASGNAARPRGREGHVTGAP